MVNNCNMFKSVYRIDSDGIVTGRSTVFRHIARNIYFAGLDVELLERAGLLREGLWKGIEIKGAIHSSWILSLSF